MSGAFARDSVLNAVAGVCTSLGGVLSTIVVARMLGVEGTGVVAFATWVVTIGAVVADLGIPGTLSRFIPELHARSQDAEAAGLSQFLFKPFVLACSILALGFLGYGLWIWQYSGTNSLWKASTSSSEPVFWVTVAGACLTQSLTSYVFGFLRGTHQFGRMARISILSAALQLGTTFVGAIWFGTSGAMLGLIAGTILPIILLPEALRVGGPLSPGLKARVARFALWTWASYAVSVFAWSRMEIFFLERSWGSPAVGLFSVSLTLSNVASQGPILLMGALLPYLARFSVDQAHKIRDGYQATIRLVALMVLPSCFGLAAISPTLIPWMYGDAFTKAIPTAMILISAAALTTTASILATYLFVFERAQFAFLIGVAGALLAVVAGLTVVPAIGPVGAAIGRTMVQAIIVTASLWYIGYYLDCVTPYRSLGRTLLAALICAIAARLTLNAIPGPPALLVAIPAGVVVYAACIRVLGGLEPEDAERLASAVTLLPRMLQQPGRAVIILLSPRAALA